MLLENGLKKQQPCEAGLVVPSQAALSRTRQVRCFHITQRRQPLTLDPTAFFPLSSHTSEPPKTATEAADGQPRDEEVPYRKSRPTYANRGQTEESRSGAYAQRMREMVRL